MPVRQFGTLADINCSIGACAITGAWSFAAIVYSEGIGNEWFFSENPSATNFYGVGTETGPLTLYRTSASRMSGALPTKEWVFVGVTKASGTVKPKMYLYRFGTATWTIQEGTTAIANAAAGATSLTFGQWNDEEQFDGKIAAAGVWNVQRTEAEMKALAGVPELQDWLTNGTVPKGLWFFNQASTSEAVSDLTGNGANQTSTANTSVVGESPPIPYVEGEEEETAGGMDIFDGASIVEADESILIGSELVAPDRYLLVEGALVPI